MIFDNGGQVVQVVPLSPANEGGRFFANVPSGVFHALLIDTPEIVFMETTIGPFEPRSTVDAPWIGSEVPLAQVQAALRDQANRWIDGS